MEELIKAHVRHLAVVEDFIWDSRDGEFPCHLGIPSICQLEAFIQGFPRYLCKSPIQVWLAASVHYDIRISGSSTESDDSSDLSSDSDNDDESLDDI